MKFVGGIILTKQPLLSDTLSRRDPVPQLLTTSLSLERMRPVKSHQQHHLSLLLSLHQDYRVPILHVRTAQ